MSDFLVALTDLSSVEDEVPLNRDDDVVPWPFVGSSDRWRCSQGTGGGGEGRMAPTLNSRAPSPGSC